MDGRPGCAGQDLNQTPGGMAAGVRTLIHLFPVAFFPVRGTQGLWLRSSLRGQTPAGRAFGGRRWCRASGRRNWNMSQFRGAGAGPAVRRGGRSLRAPGGCEPGMCAGVAGYVVRTVLFGAVE